ncbi:hypothetical protein CGCA056_v001930 [Colletotrichum aenigma]|uniref:uncharacterized protein n=1 Tax=Colletotrichum aenigma TaxID=1215731 RepID=UPI0018726A34|nr:uncharacterized protein CGCA056_v001930 [Colletotrichum aenigma]KAF5528401.1 hypothetical protein CGCA056_v001930 [Colletotrichum aenigma]
MDVLLRTLTRRNTSPPPRDGGGGRGRIRTRRDDGGGHSRQFELILEMLAKGLVEYAVRKYMPGQGGERDRGGHDDRVRARGRDDEERHRGGVPNMDADVLETIGKSILAKAMEKFGGGAEEERAGERSGGGGGGGSGRGRERTRGGSLDRYANSRALSREDRGDRENGGQRRRGQSEHGRRGSPEREPRHRDEQQQQRRHRRQGHGWTDYGPLKTELEALSNAIISLNERQPGHADCEFYDAFTERSGNVQEKIGAVMVRIREREERREERRGRRRS